MKYGVLEHRGISYNENDDSRKVVNVGDAFQIMAVKSLYCKMGIREDEIVHIDWMNINQYDGEYVILPINLSMFINSDKQSFANMSPHIIPVFLGASFKHTNIDVDQLAFFKRYEPIGCRDERTMNILRRYGVEAYLAGCIACTLPEEKHNIEKKNKVLFVDAPKLIESYIPQSIKENMECLTHEFFLDKKQIMEDPSSEILAKRIISKYVKDARLVVTSRFHSACLCIAMGIPVILAVENNYYKFSWLSKLLPLYTPENFNEINWDPLALDFREIKEKMQYVAIERIKKVFMEKKYYELSEYFENVNRSDADSLLYYHDACRYIEDNWDKEEKKEYVFWGLTENMVNIDQYICQNFCNAKLVGVYDNFKEGKYKGFSVEKPIWENLSGNRFVIVTSNSAADIAEELFDTMGKSKKCYYLCRLSFLRL